MDEQNDLESTIKKPESMIRAWLTLLCERFETPYRLGQDHTFHCTIRIYPRPLFLLLTKNVAKKQTVTLKTTDPKSSPGTTGSLAASTPAIVHATAGGARVQRWPPSCNGRCRGAPWSSQVTRSRWAHRRQTALGRHGLRPDVTRSSATAPASDAPRAGARSLGP